MPVDGIVFAERMPYPIRWQHDAIETGMIAKNDAEQVEHFAFVPIGGAPDVADGFQLLIFRNGNNQAYPIVMADGVQEIDDFEARIFGPPIDPRDTA